MYLDVLNTKNKSESKIYGLVHEKSQMDILETSPKFSLLKTATIVLLNFFEVILFRETVHKLCYYMGDFRPLLCIHPEDIHPKSAFFSGRT